jgi:hypothetical protein
MIGDIFPQEHNQVLQCKHRVARELIFSLQYGQTPLWSGESFGAGKFARHDAHLIAPFAIREKQYGQLVSPLSLRCGCLLF